MKKSLVVLAAVIAVAAVSIFAVSVINSPEKQIIGKWTNSAENSGYEFFNDGRVKMTYANFTIPILEIPFEGEVEGTYTIDKKAETITMTGTFFVKRVSMTYDFKINKETLTLSNKNPAKSVVYIKQTETVTI